MYLGTQQIPMCSEVYLTGQLSIHVPHHINLSQPTHPANNFKQLNHPQYLCSPAHKSDQRKLSQP